MKQAENDLEEVKEIAKTSIDKMVERGIQLDSLVDKTSKLKYQVKFKIFFIIFFFRVIDSIIILKNFVIKSGWKKLNGIYIPH